MSGEIPTDPEKQIVKENGSSDTAAASPERDEYAHTKGSYMTRIVDSFRRDPNASVIKKEAVSRGRFDHKSAAENTANTGLVQKLQSRHMQMIAIGGSIGTLCLL
jgi:amino acid transporter